MCFTLKSHYRGYHLSCSDGLLSLVTGLSGAPYAKRHWNMSQEPGSKNICGHRFFAVLEAIPVLGGLAALFERIVVCASNRCFNKPQHLHSNSTPSLAAWDIDDTEKLHFTWEDIAKLATLNLGLRHVSIPEEAEREAADGFRFGCSLNLSPQYSKLDAFNARSWKEIAVHERDLFVKSFQKSVDGFIHNSLRHDCIYEGKGALMELNQTRVNEVARVVNSCRFSIVDYGPLASMVCDHSSWGAGLGRHPKCTMPGDAITPLPAMVIHNLESLTEIVRDTRQGDEIYSRMTTCYRNAVIRAIRARPNA